MLNLIYWFDFKLEPIFTSAPAAPQNTSSSIGVKSDPKNDYLTTLTKVKYIHMIHTILMSANVELSLTLTTILGSGEKREKKLFVKNGIAPHTLLMLIRLGLKYRIKHKKDSLPNIYILISDVLNLLTLTSLKYAHYLNFFNN